MNLNDWDDVPADAVHTVPDHMVADAPEDDLPVAHAGEFAPDEHEAHNAITEPAQRLGYVSDGFDGLDVPAGEEDL